MRRFARRAGGQTPQSGEDSFLDIISAKKSMVDEMTVQAVKSARKARKNR